MIIDKIESETFKSDDINSIISLYEASYLSTKSDIKLREVIRPFAKKQIRKFVDGETCNLEVREKAIHALEMPYHWRMRRLETRWYLDSYDNKHDTNLVLIEFAKLDFNIVQIAHQEDLKYVSRYLNRLIKAIYFTKSRIIFIVYIISNPLSLNDMKLVEGNVFG